MSVHDDPVVVDNGPVRVDFGVRKAKKTARDGKDTYVRNFTPVRLLIAAVIDPNGLRERVRVHKLGIGSLVFKLRDGNRMGDLTFSLNLKGQLEVTPDEQWGFQLDEANLLESRSGAPRIVDIVHRGKSLAPFPLEDRDQTKRVVVVTLMPGVPSPLASLVAARTRDAVRKRGR